MRDLKEESLSLMGAWDVCLAWNSANRSSEDFLAAKDPAANSDADRKAGSQRILSSFVF